MFTSWSFAVAPSPLPPTATAQSGAGWPVIVCVAPEDCEPTDYILSFAASLGSGGGKKPGGGGGAGGGGGKGKSGISRLRAAARKVAVAEPHQVRAAIYPQSRGELTSAAMPSISLLVRAQVRVVALGEGTQPSPLSTPPDLVCVPQPLRLLLISPRSPRAKVPRRWRGRSSTWPWRKARGSCCSTSTSRPHGSARSSRRAAYHPR